MSGRRRASRTSPASTPPSTDWPELPCTEWHGLIFVDGSGTAPALEGQLAELEPLIAPYEPERLRVAGTHDYVVSANWKILTENYQECYHCPMIHPELCEVSPPKSGDNYSHRRAPGWVARWTSARTWTPCRSTAGAAG